jgi:BirA family transcriptional regulator, biotin operon repressor / biotin---[acetyl-CoA-carboxylase] ligase
MALSPLVFSVLRLLSDGDFRSGEAMARQLQCSRGSVWNAIKAAQQAGLTVFSVRGRGYRLAEPLAWLEREAIESALGTSRASFRLEIVDCVDSTNTRLLERAANGADSGWVLAAEWQTRGRGRRGRNWLSPLAGGLTFSLLWRFFEGPGFLSGLSLAVGLALVRALERMGANGVLVKWPNDVLCKGRKLAGVLIELAGEAQGPSTAVIGVGMNVRLADTIKAAIDQPTIDLVSVCGHEIDRNHLLAASLIELREVLGEFAREGFAPFAEEWNRRHAYAGASVTLLLADGAHLSGKVEGAEQDGSLVLATTAGTRRFYGGEISLRP